MAALLFVGRVAFICNLFFVLCLLLRHTHFTIPAASHEFVIVIGWVLPVLLNLIFVLTAAVLLVAKKLVPVSRWLIAANTCFFFFQLFYRLIFTF